MCDGIREPEAGAGSDEPPKYPPVFACCGGWRNHRPTCMYATRPIERRNPPPTDAEPFAGGLISEHVLDWLIEDAAAQLDRHAALFGWLEPR